MSLSQSETIGNSQVQLNDVVPGQGTSKAAKARHKLAKLRNQDLGSANAPKVEHLSEATRGNASHRLPWHHHSCNADRHDMYGYWSEVRSADMVRFLWFPLSLILVLLGAKWGSEMGIVRQMDDLHAEVQHLKAQENVAHCLSSKAEEALAEESGALQTGRSYGRGEFSFQGGIRDSSVESGSRYDEERRILSPKVMYSHTPALADMGTTTTVAQATMENQCRLNTSSQISRENDSRQVQVAVQAHSRNGHFTRYTTKATSLVTGCSSFFARDRSSIDRQRQLELTAPAVIPPALKFVGASSQSHVLLFSKSPKNASWQLNWGPSDMQVATESNSAHCFQTSRSREGTIGEKPWLLPWLVKTRRQSRHLESSRTSRGPCAKFSLPLRASINLSWQCNSPECLALFSSQMQLMRSFEDLTSQNPKLAHMQPKDSHQGATNWQLSWSSYLQKVVRDAGAEMSFIARSTCGRYAQYLQQVVEDASKAMHQDRCGMWRLPWFGSLQSQRHDLPLFAAPTNLLDNMDMFQQKATWRLVWTQSML